MYKPIYLKQINRRSIERLIYWIVLGVLSKASLRTGLFITIPMMDIITTLRAENVKK